MGTIKMHRYAILLAALLVTHSPLVSAKGKTGAQAGAKDMVYMQCLTFQNDTNGILDLSHDIAIDTKTSEISIDSSPWAPVRFLENEIDFSAQVDKLIITAKIDRRTGFIRGNYRFHDMNNGRRMRGLCMPFKIGAQKLF